MMEYTKLSLPEITAAIRDLAEEARITFGTLQDKQLNWKPDETRWSVAQCFDHLVSSNRQLVDQAKSALAHPPTSVWQRLPLWPAMFGRLLVSTQGPKVGRKYVAHSKATPASRIRPDIIPRFVDQHRELEAWTGMLDERTAKRTIMISPFAGAITYSVLDGLRLLVAHDHRHFEQARRVLDALPR
jgi:hypothetical protein